MSSCGPTMTEPTRRHHETLHLCNCSRRHTRPRRNVLPLPLHLQERSMPHLPLGRPGNPGTCGLLPLGRELHVPSGRTDRGRGPLRTLRNHQHHEDLPQAGAARRLRK